jgi:hypothetical protein
MVSYTKAAALLAALVANEQTQMGSSFGGFVPETQYRQTVSWSGARSSSVAFYSSSQHRSPRSSLSMLKEATGKDGLEELTKNNSPLSKTMRSTPSAVRKIASYASVPAAAVAGFVMTPGNKAIVHGVGAAITGLVGGIGASRLNAEAISAAKPALAQLLFDKELNDPELPSEVVKLQTEYGLADDEFMEIATDIYKRYIMSMVKNPYTKTAEINELITLKNVLSLDNIAVGEAHAMAAEDTYRTTCTFTPEEDLEDPEHPDRMSLDKLLFLSERAFKQNDETPEAFVFEFSRVAKAMKLSPNSGLIRVNDVAKPFYERALSSTRFKLETGQVSSDMLARARTTLGISDDDAQDMHLTAYAEEVKSLLGIDAEGVDQATLQFPVGAIERLDSLRDVFGISESDAQYEISVEVTPLFQALASEVFEEVLGESDPVTSWTQLTTRQNELSLTATTMLPLLDSVVTQALGSPLEEASGCAGVNNEGGVYTKLNEALAIKAKVGALLDQSGGLISVDSFFDPDSKSACFTFLPIDMRKKMYKMYLSKAVREGGDGKSLSDEAEKNLSGIKSMLGISDDMAGEVATAACGPILEKRLAEAKDEVVGGDATSEVVEKLKGEIDELVSNLKISDQLVLKNKQQMYKDYLRFVAQNSPSGIPSKSFVERLQMLRDLFSLKQDDVVEMHLGAFGSSYKKSVKEAMGVTGIIDKEFREPLEQLRDRLGVGSENAKNLFNEAVKEKIRPMVKRIEAELERQFLSKEQIAQKRGRDAGADVFLGGGGASGDLGIGTQGNMMGDIVNLVDFYTQNDVAEEKEGEDFYPVTALGIKAVEIDMADAMYRQFLVGGFTAKGDKLVARYEEAAPIFGRILGLTPKQMEATGANVGTAVYENFIANALKTKSSLDQQDMMFLANMQGKLGVSSEKGETMLVDASKKVLKDQANDLFDSPNLTPADIKTFRDRCAGMGLDIVEDLGYSKKRVSALFVLEITDGIEKGTITPDNAEYIAEVQEGLGISEEDCEKAFANSVSRKVDDSLERINKELLRGREDLCIGPIMTIVRFASFLDGEVDGVSVKEDRAYKILGMFEASDFGGLAADAIENQKQVLKKTLGL